MIQTDCAVPAITYGMSDDAVLTEPEVRQTLGLSKITLHRMRQLVDCGGLPYVRLSPGRIGYLRRDVRAFLTARRVGNLPEPGDARLERFGRSGSDHLNETAAEAA